MRISSLDDWLSPTPVYTHSGKGYVLVGSSNGMLRLFDGLTGAVRLSYAAMGWVTAGRCPAPAKEP